MSKKISYSIIVTLFFIFFLFITFFDRPNIEQKRVFENFEKIDDVICKEVQDSEAPIGVRKEYTFRLKDIEKAENSLEFYTVHHYVEVYINSDLVYALKQDPESVVGDTVSSNWISIPILQEDQGAEVKVILTPIYSSVKNRSFDFLLGSRYDIFLDCLGKNFVQLLVSGMCIILGVLMILFHIINHDKKYWNIVYLGVLSLLIGLWKISDLKVAPMLLPQFAKGFGYITLGCIPLIGITVLLYAKQVFVEVETKLLDMVNTVALIVSGVILACQVTGVAEFRETLIYSHIMLAIIIVVIIVVTLKNFDYVYHNKKSKLSKFFVIGLTISMTCDIAIFYMQGSSAGAICSIFLFFVYTLSVFILYLLEINQKVSTDSLTGLFNKDRWNQVLRSGHLYQQTIAIMVLDLNSLKKVNDLYGHEVGDRMIFNFANILKNTMPANCSIYRWGGDEFSVLAVDTSHEQMQQLMETIALRIEAYNKIGVKPELYYAAGYAISSDYEDISTNELFQKADENMYKAKKEWYQKRAEESLTET